MKFDNNFVPGFIVSSSELWGAWAVDRRALVAFAVWRGGRHLCVVTVVKSGEDHVEFANIQLLGHCQVFLICF